jgi:hypothetical protein
MSALVFSRGSTVPYAGVEPGRSVWPVDRCAMKRVWLRGAVFLGGVLAYRVACDLLDRELTDAYVCATITIICGVIVAMADL